MMKEKLSQIRAQAIKQIENSDALEKLNEVRVNILGKKGELTAVLKSMKDVAPEERPKVGQMVNETREEIEKLLRRYEENGESGAGSKNESRSDRCDASGKEKLYWAQASQYNCTGRGGAHLCGNGL